jgi:hypothetical protein
MESSVRPSQHRPSSRGSYRFRPEALRALFLAVPTALSAAGFRTAFLAARWAIAFSV